MSNSLSKARRNKGRPKVCKSIDPFSHYPPAIFWNANWGTSTPGRISNAMLTGLPLARVVNTARYVGIGIDNLAQPFSVTLKLTTPPFTGTIRIDVLCNATPPFTETATLIGVVPPWPEVRPFTSPVEPLIGANTAGGGNHNYQVP